MKLSEVKIGKRCLIIKVLGEGELRHRLLEMGVIPGTYIEITKKAPLGDPIMLRLRNYDLTLRKEDADLIEVTYENSVSR